MLNESLPENKRGIDKYISSVLTSRQINTLALSSQADRFRLHLREVFHQPKAQELSQPAHSSDAKLFFFFFFFFPFSFLGGFQLI